jgi:hypothetical protein
MMASYLDRQSAQYFIGRSIKIKISWSDVWLRGQYLWMIGMPL